jgi:transposase
MSAGYSLTSFAGQVGVSRAMVGRWMRAYPRFAEAVAIGQAKRTAYLETALIEGETGPRLNAFLYALKTAAPDEWRDKPNAESAEPVRAVLTVKFI